MKKITLLLLSVLFSFQSCSTPDVEVDEATLQQIVSAAVAAAMAQYPNSQAIAAAAAAAAADAVTQGLAGQDAAIQAALDAANALTNPPLENVGTGGVTLIEGSVTWTNDKIWILDGKIVVVDGGNLTIEAGTIIKAQNGLGADSTTLVIAKGGTINAVGTAEKPIIFTDVNDNITYANDGVSPNRRLVDRGKWGSVIILGKASVGEDGGEDDIEGIVPGYDFTRYGGNDDADNSGILKYVSIRHSGTDIGNGDELQGLTLGGVGNGTTISDIEIIGSNDDGIEIFGGSVDVTNLVIINHKDDGIDLDEGYKGTITNAVVVMASDSDNPFEIDGTEDSTGTIDGQFTVRNVTVFGDSQQEATNTMGHWKSSATGLTQNVVYRDFPSGSSIEGIDSGTYQGQGTATAAGQLLFDNFDFITTDDLSTITTVSGASDWAQVLSSQAASTGANLSVFSWTLLQ